MTRRGTGSGTEPDQAGRPPLLPAVAVAGRDHLPPPFRGSGLPAATSASRTARAPHRDLAGGGTGSASARPSRAAGARCPPSASRQPLTSRSGPALGSATGASASAQPARPATSSPEHRESGEASRHPKPCPASNSTESRWPSQPHRLPAARPEVAGRGLRRDRSGHFKKKKNSKLQRTLLAAPGVDSRVHKPTRRPSLIGEEHDLRVGHVSRPLLIGHRSACIPDRKAAFRLVSIHLAACFPWNAVLVQCLLVELRPCARHHS